MKEILSILLLFIFCISCKVKTSDTKTASDSTLAPVDTLVHSHVSAADVLHDSDYSIYNYLQIVQLGSDKLQFTLHIPYKKFYIYEAGSTDKKYLQEFTLSEEVNYEEGVYAENPDLSFTWVDFNFDGFKDLKLIRIPGMTNTFFDIYLYQPADKKFVRHDALSELSTPEIDSVTNTISFFNNGGMAGGWHTSGICKWNNGELINTRIEEQTSAEGEPEIFIRTISINEGVKMKVASKVRIEKMDCEREKQCLLEGEWTEFDRVPNLIFAETNEHVVRSDGRDGKCE